MIVVCSFFVNGQEIQKFSVKSKNKLKNATLNDSVYDFSDIVYFHKYLNKREEF